MRVLFTMCSLLAFHAASLFGIANYQLVDLNLKGYTSSDVTSINAKGYICGHLLDGRKRYIFVLDPNQKITTRNEKLNSYHMTINNSNEVFGSVVVRARDQYWEFNEEVVYQWRNPFNYFQIFNFDHLGFPTNQFSTANEFKTNAVWDVNDLGQMLVMNNRSISDAINETSTKKNLIWVYDKGNYNKIQNKQLEAAFKINNHSQILGYFHTGSSLNHNLKEHTTIYNLQDKTVRVLDIPSSSLGLDMNDNGQVVGICYQEQDKVWMGFLAEPTGEIIYINNFRPKAINNKGQVVGTYLYDEKKGQPTLWENGSFYDLKELTGMKDNQGNVWESFDYAVDINDEGWIIGNGTIKEGGKHGFLLKPVK